MNYYKAVRKMPLKFRPAWMILRSTKFQEYKVLLQDKIETERSWFGGDKQATTAGITKTQLNKFYHILPITEEEAVTEVFLENG